MSDNGLTSALVKAFAAFLDSSMPSLEEVHDDFPNASQELVYPAATVMTGQPQYDPALSYVVRKEDPEPGDDDYEEPADGDVAKKRVIRVVGRYVYPLQVDLWCQTKFDRNRLYEEFFRAMHQDPAASGVRLQLGDYFDEWVSFTLSSIRFGDTEEQSQRGEWRVIAEVVADCRAITQALETPIAQVQTTLETPNSIATEDENPPSSII